MASCQCQSIESRFDDVYAAEKLAAYRAGGPDPSTRALLDLLLREGVEGRTLLDIGGGVGAVQHELIGAGLASVVEVEASAAYAAACDDEARRRGHAERIDHVVGEFGAMADQVGDADIVTLDRSLCCWHDMPDLVGRSVAKARLLYGLVYPRDTWWVRHGWRLYSNARHVLRRHPMRVFTHRRRDVEAIIHGHGMALRSAITVGVWQIAVYSRRGSGAPVRLPLRPDTV